MADIIIKINGQFVSKSSKNAGSAGDANNTALIITFDDEWSGFAKRIIWRNARGENETSVLLVPEIEELTASYKTHIPPEATDAEGWCSFTVEGYYENNPSTVQRSVTDRLFVAYTGTKKTWDITPDEAMQLHSEFEQLMPKVNEKMQKTEESINEVCRNFEIWEAYNDDSVYKKGNKVCYEGQSYVCIREVCGVSPENENFWTLISGRGEKGERGLQGIKGERGDIGPRGEKGDKGDRGEMGEQGINGVVVPSDGFYSFNVDENGDLWVHYPDETTPPDISLNENGELIISTGNNRFNAGNVKGPKPEKGIDYFTPEDIKNLNIPAVDEELDPDSENTVKNKTVSQHINTLYAESGNLHSDVREIRQSIGNIDAALEELHTYAQAIIGGEA